MYARMRSPRSGTRLHGAGVPPAIRAREGRCRYKDSHFGGAGAERTRLRGGTTRPKKGVWLDELEARHHQATYVLVATADSTQRMVRAPHPVTPHERPVRREVLLLCTSDMH